MTMPIATMASLRQARLAMKVANTLDPESNDELTAKDIATEAFLSARQDSLSPLPTASTIAAADIPRPPTVDMVGYEPKGVSPQSNVSYGY